MYKEYKLGNSYRKLSNKYNVSNVVTEYIVYLIDRHGYDVLRTTKNCKYTIEEKIKRLELENLYLKAELEYSKKWRTIVQARKNQQSKKK